MEPRIVRLEELYLPDDFITDFSPESLVRLEALILRRFPSEHDLLTGEARDFVEVASGYLGESLLRAGGGSWRWDDDPESESYRQPVVDLEVDAGLGQVAPALLVHECARARTGRVLDNVYATIQRAVAARTAQDPSWTPTKEWTPGVDSDLTPVTSEFLTNWLAEREAAFGRWAASYGGGSAVWDFSAESLDALESLTRRLLTSQKDFEKPEHQDFLDGASWYLGEVMRRLRGASWTYNGGEPDPYNPWMGYPYLFKAATDPPHGAVPFLILQATIRKQQEGYLRVQLDRFS